MYQRFFIEVRILASVTVCHGIAFQHPVLEFRSDDSYLMPFK